MDSKRKANGPAFAAEELDDRGSKRRKVSDGAVFPTEETPKSTTDKGMELLELVKNCKDKSGRPAALDFLTLPEPKGFPQYYAKTKMPIAIDTIEDRLKNQYYPTLTSLESDLKRLIQNAKEFNARDSLIHKDAERIRKLMASWMPKYNPAYRDPNYAPFPTPIPQHLLNGHQQSIPAVGDDLDAEGESDHDVAAFAGASATPKTDTPPSENRRTGVRRASYDRKRRASSTPGPNISLRAVTSYSGLSFQQAQEKIVEEIAQFKEDEDDDYPKYEAFINLPDRKAYKDYYKVIPHPVSLNKLKKEVRGTNAANGRESTGVTNFKTWESFEEEASLIWKNALHYNEDGSDISLLAKDLEIFFHKRLAVAKKVVPEPAQPKLKLKVSAQDSAPKIMLRMGVKGSPAESPAPTPTSVTTNSSNPVQNNASAGLSQPTAVPRNVDRTRSTSGSVDAQSTAPSAVVETVKNEEKPSPSLVHTASTQSPLSLNSTFTPSISMPPPMATTTSTNGSMINGAMAASPHHVPSPYQALPSLIHDSKWRASGRNLSDAMITKVNLRSHPGLNLPRHFTMDLDAKDTLSQQSFTVNFPPTHYYLQIKPSISPSLMERQHKLFVTSGSTRLLAMPQVPGQPVDQTNPLFEARLLPGVNRIEIELIAALPKAARTPTRPEAELEKFTIFANLSR